jgi:uncharacterized protein (TIRG00374 family)
MSGLEMTKQVISDRLNWLALLSSPWLKVGFALVVLWALVAFNRIELSSFTALKDSWVWLLMALGLMMPPYLIVSYRFYLVLRNQGVECELPLAVHWTMIGSFFDLVMPSNSGGDIVKVGYVLKQVGAGLRTKSLMAIAFDRVLGVIGLFLLAAVSCIIGWEEIQALSGSRDLVLLIALLSFGPLAVFRVLGARRVYGSKRVRKLMTSLPVGERLLHMIGCFNSLREKPKDLVLVLGLSMLNHMFWCAALFCIVMAFSQPVGLVEGFTVFPVAIFSNIFGFAGGFGIGTAAFDVIFAKLLDIQVGASIGLMFQMLSAVSRLSGLPFYLMDAGTKN